MSAFQRIRTLHSQFLSKTKKAGKCLVREHVPLHALHVVGTLNWKVWGCIFVCVCGYLRSRGGRGGIVRS